MHISCLVDSELYINQGDLSRVTWTINMTVSIEVSFDAFTMHLLLDIFYLTLKFVVVI